jgi:hypothetical protein
MAPAATSWLVAGRLHLKLDQRISEMVGALRAIADNKVRDE